MNGLKDRTFYTEHPILELTERFYGNAVPGPQQGSCGGESGGNAHDKLRVGALERARKTRKPQTGICHHNDRAQLKTRVDKRCQT